MQKVTQKKLARYTTLANKIDALKLEYFQIKQELILDIEAGAKVENGPRTAKVETIERRTVSWKDVVIREKGEGYAKQVLASTPGDLRDAEMTGALR